ncbi:MAG: hypothetical protein MJ064_09570 [Lachnospiraceae bacterium]|nr:hypothetical protein [Lachnospiraceae bacterium]
MKTVWRLLSVAMVLAMVLSLAGCGKNEEGQKEKSGPFEMTLNGVTYDLSMDLPELIGKFEENDVFVCHSSTFYQLGKRGVYKQSSGFRPDMEKARVDVWAELFIKEDLPDDLEANRNMYSETRIIVSPDNACSYSVGKAIGGEMRDLSGYFNLDEDTYNETINETIYKLNADDTVAEAFKTLDATCMAEGFWYNSFWRNGCIAAVYFDRKQVDLGKYAVEDAKAFMESRKKVGLAPMGETIGRLVQINYQSGNTIGVQYEELIDCLSTVQLMNLKREMAVLNATYKGIEKAKKGEIHTVYVVRVDEGGSLHIQMYRKNGKILVCTPEDDECLYTWQ